MKVIPDAGYIWDGDITIHDTNYTLYIEDEEALDENDQFTMPDDLYSTDLDYVYIGVICTETDVPNGVDDAVSSEPSVRKTVENGTLVIIRGDKRYTLTGTAL